MKWNTRITNMKITQNFYGCKYESLLFRHPFYIYIYTREQLGEMPLFSLVGSGNPLEIAGYMLVQ